METAPLNYLQANRNTDTFFPRDILALLKQYIDDNESLHYYFLVFRQNNNN